MVSRRKKEEGRRNYPFQAETRSPLAPLKKGSRGWDKSFTRLPKHRGEQDNSLKVPLLKGDLGGSRLLDRLEKHWVSGLTRSPLTPLKKGGTRVSKLSRIDRPYSPSQGE